MVDYIKNQLSEQGVLNKANTSKTNISYEDILFEESAHLLDELQDLSIDGKDGPDETRKMNVGIPISDDDDFEIDTIEFNIADGRVTDVPMDAALQESFYEHMFHYNDFYQEAVNTMRRFPRESEDMFMYRVNASAKKKYDQYMEQVVQEGLFGFGKVNIDSDKIRWNIHLNFGKFTEERDEECVVTLGVCYETMKNKVYKKLPIKFEQGKAYMLNLTIGLPIEFDVDVDTYEEYRKEYRKRPSRNGCARKHQQR